MRSRHAETVQNRRAISYLCAGEIREISSFPIAVHSRPKTLVSAHRRCRASMDSAARSILLVGIRDPDSDSYCRPTRPRQPRRLARHWNLPPCVRIEIFQPDLACSTSTGADNPIA